VIPLLQKHLAEAFGVAPDRSGESDAEVPITSFQCELDVENQVIYLQFGPQNRTPFVLTLPVPRAREVFDDIGKALAAAKSAPTETRQ
jgi:hypothetical protein